MHFGFVFSIIRRRLKGLIAAEFTFFFVKSCDLIEEVGWNFNVSVSLNRWMLKPRVWKW